jgi:hypothetical protein
MGVRKIFSLSLVTCAALLSCNSVRGQSLDVHHPALLNEGTNNGTIDSFGQDQFWYFTANPGNFKIVFTRSGAQEGFDIGPKAAFGAIINPAVKGSSLTGKDVPSGAVFEGHCEAPTRVLAMIEKPRSPLVRQTVSYTITITGSGSPTASNESIADPVVGVYDIMLNAYGVGKFATDGTIVTTSGVSGTWSLFDKSTRTYVVTLGQDKWTLTFEPARGFVDKNGTLIMSVKKPVR